MYPLFPGGEAKDVHEAYTIFEDYGFHNQPPWPHVVNFVICGFLTDEVLQVTLESVSRAINGVKEDEGAFVDRILKYSRHCQHVFAKT